MLAWIGLALLSASWLFGLDYYYHITPAWILGKDFADWPAWLPWAVMVAGGTLCLIGKADRLPGRWESLLAAMLAAPAVLLMPWPYRAAGLLLAAGLIVGLAPSGRVRRVARAASLAGTVLLAQALALTVYMVVTSRSHELPEPLPRVIGAVAGLLGINVGVHGSNLAAFSMRETHMFGATWELFLDPVTLGFLAGGVVLLGWNAWTWLAPGRRAWYWLGASAALAAVVALWLPLRSAVLLALYLHDVLRVDYDMPLDSMKLFWNPWVHMAALIGPVLLAWRFVRRPAAQAEALAPARPRGGWRYALGGVLTAAAVGCLTAGVHWDPPGQRRAGRLVVEEYNPQPDKIWERTDKPFDTTWYGHMAGYNYYCIYDYLSHYYQASRLTSPIDDKALEKCDVLMLKVPTRPYSSKEIDSVCRFVERGGGLLLIGEHTNVFGTGTYLNALARRFGFEFRYDCLFGIDSVFDQYFTPPSVPHPVLQHMPPMDFATSCSIEPRSWSGRAVIRCTGLKNKMADYHVDNFYPPATDTAAMRYGAFVQLWSLRHGRGRVLAFSDSTIFSNFSTFEPGKAELMLGMVEWLNHRSAPVDPRPWFCLAGVVLLGLGLWSALPWDGAWAVLLGAGLAGWAAAALAVNAGHQAAMPPPKPVRPLTHVVIDRTLSPVKWPENGFIAGKEDEYGLFERWILKLGYFTSRRQGDDVFQGNLLVIVNPNKPVAPEFREKLLGYVSSGGKVLVVDSAENTRSTANELLAPLKLSLARSHAYRGTLKSTEGWPQVPVTSAAPVVGGRPFAWLGKIPVGATVSHGKGSVTLVGFGSRFCDTQMGVIGDVVPTDDLKQVYEVEFSLLRSIVEGKPLGVRK